MSTKQTVLSVLQAAQDFVSGEALAAKCGLSRTSVWKAIKALQNDGFRIAAAQNHGYKLVAPPDVLSRERILQTLTALGAHTGAVSVFPSLDSTLSESKRQCAVVDAFRAADGTLTAEGAKLHRALIVTGLQTAGRGRMGRAFVSPAHSGVYFTLIYAPKGGVTNPALLTAAAAVAVARAIDAVYGTKATIKWVNDVFLGGKKICGILTEGFANFESGRIEAANVGIGINVHPMGFSAELAKTAGSIDDALTAEGRTPPATSRNELVATVCAELLAIYDAWEASADGDQAARAQIRAMLAEYKSRSLLLGKTVTVHPVAGLAGTPYQARVLDIDDNAALIVQTADGSKKTLQSGEVSLHGSDFAL